MAVFSLSDKKAFRKAGPSDLVELAPVPGSHPLFVPKRVLEILVYGIVNGSFIHLSGPTGSAKTSLIEALAVRACNFTAVCEALDFPVKPLRLFPVDMVRFESPAELHSRRALRDGATYDEASELVKALVLAHAHRGRAYPLVWLRELGRVHAASIQGALLDLMSKTTIHLPGEHSLEGEGISWIADSNYADQDEGAYVLVALDDALKRRFEINVALGYLSQSDEREVLAHIVAGNPALQGLDDSLLDDLARLGSAIRKERQQGNLRSVVPPTIYAYVSFLHMARQFVNQPPAEIARVTLLGHASGDDAKLATAVLRKVFRVGLDDEEEEEDEAADALSL